MTVVEKVRPLVQTVTGPSARSFAEKSLGFAALVLLLLLVRAGSSLTLKSKPVEYAVARLQIWRSSLRDPHPGSPVNLASLITIAHHPGRRQGRHFNAILLCLMSTCST